MFARSKGGKREVETIQVFIISFIIILNNSAKIEVPYNKMQDCVSVHHLTEYPKQYYGAQFKDEITAIAWTCHKRLKRYVEQCELHPMDFSKKECVPYWYHWAKNRR